MKSKLTRARMSALALLITGSALLTTGCATSPMAPPIVSKAPLGSVIIYRNGVAYFERHLPAGEKELTLRVPAERVDDFLKSLTIVDEKTGETMPVSYPTMDPQDGDDVEMRIELPKNHNGLRISYVTESPAWKPSYRLMLGQGGKAKLQGWAIVDNISGEDWKHVRVGVGSTSALSFRYDLHSVRSVERVELSSGSLLAVAPPTGGSPYTVATKKELLVLNMRQSDVGGLDELDSWNEDAGDGTVAQFQTQTARAPGSSTVGGAGRGTKGHNYRFSGRAQRAQQMVSSLSKRVRRGENIRIEGFAKDGDKHPRRAALQRANKLRNQLIANGADPEQVVSVGNGQINNDEGIRVTAEGNEKSGADTRDEAAKHAGKAATPPTVVDDGQPLGQAHFISSEAMTIERDHSAMVSILNAEATAERIYFYDPISERGSDEFAFNAVRMTNPSKYTLDSGPFTVYVDGQFLGEGLTDPILPHSTAFIPYALDRNVVVQPEITGREEIDRLITIQRGIVTTETRKIRKTKLAITNRAQEPATIYVRHKVAPEHLLTTLGPDVPQPEKLGGAHLFKVVAQAGETVELVIEEWTPVKRTVDIRTDHGIKAIALYLKAAELSPELKADLAEVVRRHSSRANLQEKLLTLGEQMRVYRTRVDEINVQLVTLRKLPQGAKLRSHLASKMQEISEKLQAATMSLADMKAELMTQRIELQDKLAEIALQSKGDKLASKER